ncbi:MAG: cytidyltransferase, partial [Patescibacteria group bacterium]
MVEIPALTGRIVDRVGAGDALFSITVPCVWAHMNPITVGFIGNVAASLKIATVGNKFPIDFAELTNYITRLLK